MHVTDDTVRIQVEGKRRFIEKMDSFFKGGGGKRKKKKEARFDGVPTM